MARRLPLLRTLVTLSALLLVGATLLLFGTSVDRVVVAKGRLVGGSQPVRAATDGRVAEVFVDAGARVAAGRPLVRLETDGLESEAMRARSRIEGLEERARALHQSVEHFTATDHPAEIRRAERDLELAELTLASAETRARLLAPLEAEGLVTRLEFEDAELERKKAAIAVEDAREAIPLLASKQASHIEGLHTEIAAIEAQLREERAVRTELERRIAASTIVAGVDGVVVGGTLAELRGRAVGEGEELLRLAHDRAGRFEGFVQDVGRSDARPGVPVKVRLDGYPWLIHGTVPGQLAFVADRRGEGRGFEVVVDLDHAESPGALYEGMTGTARIIVEAEVSLGRLLVEKLVANETP